MTRRIAYLTGEYPRATDTFVQREIAAHRDAGWSVETFAIRRPAVSEQAGPELKAERDATRYVLDCSKLSILASQIKHILARPMRYLSALRLATRTSAPGLSARLYQLFYLAEAAVVAEWLIRDRVEHFHNHFANSSCSVAMLASRISGIPFSFTVHGPAIFFEPMGWRLDEKVRQARFVSCISHYCRSQVMIHAETNRWGDLHIVHCGVRPKEYATRRHEGVGSRLLFVGRLAAVKGVPVLLESVASMAASGREVHLTLIGDGPDREALEQRATELEIESNVTFAGYKSAAEVAAELERTDVFVMASFAEGVPVVLMEALAAAVPVVATRIAGVGELVVDGVCGWTVPPGDAGALASSVEDLLDNPSRRTEFGGAGRAIVSSQFDIAREAAWLRELMNNSLEGKRSPVRPAGETRSGLNSGAQSSGLRGSAA